MAVVQIMVPVDVFLNTKVIKNNKTIATPGTTRPANRLKNAGQQPSHLRSPWGHRP